MSKLTTSLIKAVVPMFGHLGLSNVDILNGPIAQHSLPWQTPPIICEAPLSKIPLWEYFDIGVYIKAEAFYQFWAEGMAMLRNNPGAVLDEDFGWKRCSQVLRNPAQERPIWFSIPEGYPQQTTEYAGALFSLECAHVMRLSGKITKLVCDDSNYYVVDMEGRELGVKSGYPVRGGEEWDTNVSFIVQDLLRLPRGNAWVGCDYDVLAKLRSMLWEHRERVREFEGADWTLQALRVLLRNTTGHEILHHVRSLKVITTDRKDRMAALEAAIKVFPAAGLSDRQKLEQLKFLLVPAVLPGHKFSELVWPLEREAPAVLRADVVSRIQGNLETLHLLEANNNAIKIV